MKLNLDPALLTMGDMADFEDAAGVPLLDTFTKIDQSGSIGDLPMRAMIALVWVCARQDDPAFTLDDARKIKIGDLEIDVGGNGADPTPGGD